MVGKYTEALNIFDNVISSDPVNYPAYYWKGVAFYQQQLLQQSINARYVRHVAMYFHNIRDVAVSVEPTLVCVSNLPSGESTDGDEDLDCDTDC